MGADGETDGKAMEKKDDGERNRALDGGCGGKCEERRRLRLAAILQRCGSEPAWKG